MIWQTKKSEEVEKGGDAGEIFIFSKTIKGNGKIQADGGDGNIGGKGGKIRLISNNNQFAGKISVKGGASLNKPKWWENSWIQLIALISAILGIIGFFTFK